MARKDKERDRAYKHEWYTKNKGRLIKEQREYRRNLPPDSPIRERQRKYRKQYDEKNRERLNERVREYRKMNPDVPRKASKKFSKKRIQKNPDYNKEQWLKRRYGLTRDAYESMASGQGWVCAICRQKDRSGKWLSVDHDHSTGEIRGLLCGPCNIALGMIQENPAIALSMSEYIKRFEKD